VSKYWLGKLLLLIIFIIIIAAIAAASISNIIISDSYAEQNFSRTKQALESSYQIFAEKVPGDWEEKNEKLKKGGKSLENKKRITGYISEILDGQIVIYSSEEKIINKGVFAEKDFPEAAPAKNSLIFSRENINIYQTKISEHEFFVGNKVLTDKNDKIIGNWMIFLPAAASSKIMGAAYQKISIGARIALLLTIIIFLAYFDSANKLNEFSQRQTSSN